MGVAKASYSVADVAEAEAEDLQDEEEIAQQMEEEAAAKRALTVQRIRDLIFLMSQCDEEHQVWHQTTEAVNWTRRHTLGTPHTYAQSSQSSTTGAPLGSNKLLLERRSVGMLLLEQCFVSLLAVACPGCTIMELVECMINVGVVPDASLSVMLLEELWEKGEQQAVVRFLVLMERHSQDSEAEAAAVPCVSQGLLPQHSPAQLPQLMPQEVTTEENQLRTGARMKDQTRRRRGSREKQQSLDLASDGKAGMEEPSPGSPGATETATLGAGEPLVSTTRNITRGLPSALSLNSDRQFLHSSGESVARAERVSFQNLKESEPGGTLEMRSNDGFTSAQGLVSQSGGAFASSGEHPLPGSAAYQSRQQAPELSGGALCPEWEQRGLEQREEEKCEREQRLQELLQEKSIAWNCNTTAQSMKGGAGAEASVCVRDVEEEGVQEGDVDLVLHTIQFALERSQFRAALALPRRLRHDGIRLSVEAYNSALLAVVKEQELISITEHEMKSLESSAQLEALSKVEQLIFQVYGETIRREGEHILAWALEDLKLKESLNLKGRLNTTDAPSGPIASYASSNEEEPVQPEDTASLKLREQGELSERARLYAEEVELQIALECASLEASLHEKMLALWCLAGDSSKAQEAMWGIAQSGRPLSYEVMAAVLGTCSFKGDLVAVNSVVKKMEALGHKLDNTLFSIVITAAMRGNHFQVAAAAMLSMVDKGLSPERHQMASLLRLLQREGHVESYLVLCSSLSAAGFVGPCLIFLYLDFINFCIIRML